MDPKTIEFLTSRQNSLPRDFISLDLCGVEWDGVEAWGASTVFSGRFDHSIDDKGRVSIPARFREILQRDGFESLFITNFFSSSEACLVLYTPGEWNRLVGNLRQKPSFDSAMQQFQTFFIGGAHEAQVDRQGRILIPPKLRDFAGLARDVTFSAMITHFQLWDKLTLERMLKKAEQCFKDPKFMERLNL